MKAYAQTPNWTQTVGTPFNDYGYSIEKTYDGVYIVSGTTCNNDRIKSFWQTCYSQLRIGQTEVQTIKPTLNQQQLDINITASVTDFSLQMKVSNYEFQNTDAIRIACYDALGRLISSSVAIQEVIVGSTTIINLQPSELKGLLFFKVYEDGLCIGGTKALILN